MSGFDDLLGIPDLTAAPPPPQPVQQSVAPGNTPPATPTTGHPQAVPGAATPTKAPAIVTMGAVSRAPVLGGQTAPVASVIDLTSDDFNQKLGALLSKDLEIANHDRSMATALLRVHLDRAEELDKLPLSMPVATVISDNTGATLKSLELAMRAGERVHKIAELLVAAQKNEDGNSIAALKVKMAAEKGAGNGWDDGDLPDNRPA